MKCEVCGSAYRKVDTSLICLNGHTLQNITEVAHEDIAPAARTRRIKKKKKTKEFFSSSGCNLMRMILLKLVFEEARVFFEIRDDSIFKYFTGFFEFRENKLESSIGASKEWLVTLIYCAKRIDRERRGKILMLSEFLQLFSKFDLSNRLTLIKNRFPALGPPSIELRVGSTFITKSSLKKNIDYLSNPYITSRPYRSPNTDVNGIYEDIVDVSKANFRSGFKNDIDPMCLYFDQLCSTLSVCVTEDLKYFFKKFIFSFNYEEVIFPEYDIVLFIAIYLINKSSFEGTEVESKILNYFGIPKSRLMAIVLKKSKELDNYTSPECYINLMKRRNRRRFKRLRHAIEFVEAFKVNKAKRMLKKKEKKKKAKLISIVNDK